MKNILRILSCSLLLISGSYVAKAQDPHFDQYYTFASYLNPALVGNYDGSYRLAALYRQQWTSSLGSTGGYRTVGADVDVSLLEGYLKHSKLALGVAFLDDRSGTAGLDYLNATMSLAYHQGFGRDGSHHLSIGLQGGYIQKRVDDPTFGDQHSGENFSQVYPTQETLTKGIQTGDLSAGLYWKSNFHDVVRLGFGLGVFHIIQPKEQMVLPQAGSGATPIVNSLDRKYSADINLEVLFGKGKHMSLSPELIFLRQGPSQEITPGLFWSYYFQTGFRKNNIFSLGVRYRYSNQIGDAVIPMAMAEFRNVRIGFGYDVNISGLDQTTHDRGAFEVGVSFTGESIKGFKGSRALPSRRF
jgi:type IX secretion system PorP/SprF family membrane protein